MFCLMYILTTAFLVLGESELSAHLDKAPALELGAASIKGRTIKPFNATWYTRAKAEGKWRSSGTLTETATPVAVDGKQALQRVQIIRQPNGVQVKTTATFLRDDLSPVSSKSLVEAKQLPPSAVNKRELSFDGLRITGSQTKVDGSDVPFEPIDLDRRMFDGGTFGLVLAALPLKKGYMAKLPVVYLPIKAKYWVVVRVVGQKTFDAGRGRTVKAWAVETDWHDVDSGDISPGGGSGGTYYVVPNPPAGYPHVPKYINDSFDTEVITQLLPLPGEEPTDNN